MGRKKTLTIGQAEQVLMAIQSLGDKKDTTRVFNFALNFNYDELEVVLKRAYKSFHKKPDDVKEYEELVEDLIWEFASVSRSKAKDMGVQASPALIPQKNMNAFNEEADRIKEGYQEQLDEWDKLWQENVDLKTDTEVEVEFYVVHSQEVDGTKVVPNLEPRTEYWIGHFIDYTRELGAKTPDRKDFREMKSPEELLDEAHDEVEEETPEKEQ